MTAMTEDVRKTCALVVEDDPNIVDLIRSNLAVRGFDTVVSVDGMRALQLLETEDPDIVLLDLMLPEADGFELCRQIRERSPVAIIVVSARGGERDKVTALHMGADDYMTKPFSIEELLARITATLRRTRPAAPTEQAPPVIVGGLEGVIITRLRLPSFVVTLAGQLLALGLLLEVMDWAAPGSGGTIRLYNNVLSDIEGGAMSPLAGWIVMVVAVALAGTVFIIRDSRRRASNLAAPPASVTALKIVLMAIAGVVVVLIGNTNRGVAVVVRGVPWVVPLILVIVVAYSFLLGRTRSGRYFYAIGGNAEAARRAGINLSRIRVAAFVLAGLTAGIMGIVYASYLGSVSTNVPGGQNVLYAVAAAVIGGTSLFGGRGKMLGAVLGGVIVAVIYNGLELLGLGAAAQYMWTAAVLLAAVTVDTVARRGRSNT